MDNETVNQRQQYQQLPESSSLSATAGLLWRRRIISVLLYAYLLRVAILITLIMLLIGPALCSKSINLLLGGLFDLAPAQVFFLALTAFLTAWSIAVVGCLILINGGERVNVSHFFNARSQPQFNTQDLGRKVRTKRIKWTTITVGIVIALPIVITVCVISPDQRGQKIVAAFGGFFLALLLIWAILLFYHHLVKWLLGLDLRDSSAIFDLCEQPSPEQNDQPADRQEPPGNGFFGPVYDSEDRPIGRHLYPGHVLAIMALVLTSLFYLIVGIWKSMHLGTPTIFPTLAYALLLLMLLCWLFSGITFVFDRYRVPVLLLLLGWGIITGLITWSDYTYDVIRKSDNPTVSADQVVNAPQTAAIERDPSTMIVVASNGGGIQAAAWTARVLTGLECQARKELPNNPRRFGDSIRLISSVSGGSVGAMYFVNAYTQNGLPATQAGLEHIVDQAMTSSIDEIGYGMVFPDLWHSFLPNPWLKNDRGKALERAWHHTGMLQASTTADPELAPNNQGGPSQDCPDVNEAATQTPTPPLTNGLETWRTGVTAGWRPATIFNATIADTGERLLFSTVDFPVVDKQDKQGKQDKQFNQPQIFGSSKLYCGYDISIATAARLSATFPYVTPAARAAIDESDAAAASQACPSASAPPLFHAVDGGYYDNYGMATLTEWLDKVLLEQQRSGTLKIEKVLVIQIRAAPDPIGRPYSCEAEQQPAHAEEARNEQRDNPRGWFYQMFAPVATLLNVRDSAQGAHNDVEFDLLQRVWASDVEISTVTFQYTGPDTPLNWHLTETEKKNIQAAWDIQKGCKEWQQVKQFLSSP